MSNESKFNNYMKGVETPKDPNGPDQAMTPFSILMGEVSEKSRDDLILMILDLKNQLRAEKADHSKTLNSLRSLISALDKDVL